MLTLEAINVEEAWNLFRVWMNDSAWGKEHLREVAPRKRHTLEIREPVATTYRRPEECVLLDPERDCNPFFHLYEALWILAGHNDVNRLAFYNPGIRQFSDDGETFNGGYGERLRSYFGEDQLDLLVEVLRKDPDTRRGVLELWEVADLLGDKKDVPCNVTIAAKVREGRLNLTVFNRSNDAVWGCYGANAVQFSFLLQYLAARVGVGIGTYAQVSDSLHVYLDGEPGKVWARCQRNPPNLLQGYSYVSRNLTTLPLVREPGTFEVELRRLLSRPDGKVEPNWFFEEPFLENVAHPLCVAHQLYLSGEIEEALGELHVALLNAPRNDWLTAGVRWLLRRKDKRLESSTTTRGV